MTCQKHLRVTPSVMKWARIHARLDVESAANNIKVSQDEIIGWENGSQRPTMSDAIKSAEVYHQPVGVFFMSKPPIDEVISILVCFDANNNPIYGHISFDVPIEPGYLERLGEQLLDMERSASFPFESR